jgi:type VI secretion system protein ImpA
MPLRSDILDPIPGDNPAGAYLRHEPLFNQIKEARRSDDEASRRPEDGEAKKADWVQVVALTTTGLATQSKDLELGGWLVEGLLRREGFEGLRSGLDVVRGLLEKYWDTVHPVLATDDDDPAADRVARLSWLGQYIVAAVQDTPLNKKGHGLLKYKESRAVGSELDCAGDEKKLAARQAKIDAGKIAAEEFDRAMEETPKQWYKTLVTDVKASAASLAALDALSRQRFADDPPDFSPLRDAVSDVERVVRQLLDEKLKTDPDPIDVSAGADDAGAGATAEGDLPVEPRSPADAVARLAVIARYLRQQDPANMGAYLMLRGLRWGELRAAGGAVDPRTLLPPSTGVRAQLRGLFLDGKWHELLELCENVMARPEGRGWLDLQRYAVTACNNLGGEYEHIARAIRSELALLLRDIPSLPDMVLMDDMPTANAETRQWLNDSRIVAESAEPEEPVAVESPAAQAPASREPRGGAGDVAFKRAKEAIQTGDVKRAIEILMAEVTRERSERARFLRRSQIASIMVDAGLEPLAKPVLEELMGQVESHQLEGWETGDLVAQPMSLLYRCLAKLDTDADRRQELYLRIAKLDPVQAMNLQA